VKVRYLAAPLAGLAVVIAGVLAFGDLNGSLVYYLTPTEAVAQRADFDGGRRFRLAGSVAPGSVAEVGDTVAFTMTDGTTAVAVAHTGVPPQLFQERIDVVVEGTWQGELFRSDTMLVKHDENYYPPDDAPAEAAP
jgi:cytochrome c-type biogenesis protein CcmE